jgi:hypothetical protein
LLIQRPQDSKLASLFHWSCEQTRDLPVIGRYVECEYEGVDPHDKCSTNRYTEFPPAGWENTFGPRPHPLDGITAQDVGRQVARYLRLPNE